MNSYIKSHILPLFANTHYFNVTPDPTFLAAIEKGKEMFRVKDCVEYRPFPPKKKNHYLVVQAHFPEALEGVVGDIGDREGNIKEFVHGTVVTVDKNNPDLESFDWDKKPLPFDSASLDSVLCLDTLEHISDVHAAFADLLRVSKRYVVISLPNCWKKTLNEIAKGRGFRSSYGLPLERPIDRHRWYMNTEDIEDFMYYNAAKQGFEVRKLVHYAPRMTWWHRLFPLVQLAIPEKYFKNFFVQGVFVELERKTQAR